MTNNKEEKQPSVNLKSGKKLALTKPNMKSANHYASNYKPDEVYLEEHNDGTVDVYINKDITVK